MNKPTLKYRYFIFMSSEEYDEFGNPIGDISEDDSFLSSTEETASVEDAKNDEHLEKPKDVVHLSENEPKTIERIEQHAILSLKDKTDNEFNFFGPDVETIYATQDTLEPEAPIVKPLRDEKFKIEEQNLPKTTYSKQYLWNLLHIPSKTHNVTICGGLYSGKTSFVDLLVKETHPKDQNNEKENNLKYTNNKVLELERGISIHTSLMTLLLSNLKGNSIAFNIFDTPGHSSFIDDINSSISISDNIVIVVDAAEDITESLLVTLEIALKSNSKLFLMISKIDRLFLELRLTPLDAYYKLRKIIDNLNNCLIKNGASIDKLFSPSRGNVCFESAELDCCFTLDSFVATYRSKNPKLNLEGLATVLWGDVYYFDGRFTTEPSNKIRSAKERSFVKFILEPIYKLTMMVLTVPSKKLEYYTREILGIHSISHREFRQDPSIILKALFRKYFGETQSAFADMIQSYGMSAMDNNENAFRYNQAQKFRNFTEPLIHAIRKCDPSGPLVAKVSRLVNTSDGSRFYAEVRVFSGTLKSKSSVTLLGETYSSEFNEDMKIQKIKKTFFNDTRYRVEVGGIPAGAIGLISGHEIDTFITRTATIYGLDFFNEHYPIFNPFKHVIQPVFKIAVQPENPSDMGRLISGLKMVNRAYPGCEITVEEGGDQAISGYSELYLDCLMHDLRKLYSQIDIKVSDPMTRFAETCIDTSSVRLPTKSVNKQNEITIIAEPLDEGLTVDIANGLLAVETGSRKLSRILRKRYKWDSLAARSVWAFGPLESHSVCILCDDTLPEEVDKDRLLFAKDAIIQGFKWASREGPLCEEPIRGVRFRIIDAKISSEYNEANGAQLIQMARQACYCAIMTATPKLLEPVFKISMTSNGSLGKPLSKIISRRRGRIISEKPVDGTQLFRITGFSPVIDSVGLETDIRLLTQGKTMCEMSFSQWQIAPGDPLDKSCYLPILRPVPISSLARDFTLKTRKQKGLDGEPTLENYVDRDTWRKLSSTGLFI